MSKVTDAIMAKLNNENAILELEISRLKIALQIRKQIGFKTFSNIGASDLNFDPIKSKGLSGIRQMKNLQELKGGMSFKVMSNSQKITHIGVFISSLTDLYLVVFFTRGGILYQQEGIHFTELPEVIEKGIES